MIDFDVNRWCYDGIITFRDNDVPIASVKETEDTTLIVSDNNISAPLMWESPRPIADKVVAMPTSMYDRLTLNAGVVTAGELCETIATTTNKIFINVGKGENEKMYTGRTYGERARSDRDIDRAIKTAKEREQLEEKRCREANEERQKMVQDEVTAELRAIFDKAFKKVAVDYDNWAIIVYWEDGVKTVVRCTEDDSFDEEKGVLLALLKRAYGSSTQAKKFFDRTLKREAK